MVEAVRVALTRISAAPPGLQESFAVRGGETLTLRRFVELFEQVAGRPVDVTLGARPYRAREVMQPWLGETLPGWTAKTDLREGLATLLQAPKT